MKWGFNGELTYEQVLLRISEYDIFTKYCESFKQPGKKFHSEFREDKNPSCVISDIGGRPLYKDFGTGESFRAIGYVMAKFNLTYSQALEKINEDFSLGLIHSFPEYSKRVINPSVYLNGNGSGSIKYRNTTVIQIKSREFNKDDYDYWYGNYRIPINTLKLFGVKPITHFWINGKMYRADKLAYSYEYYWDEDIFRRKIYQPKSEYKWFSNGGDVVQGEGVLPKSGDLLIVTKSLKDVMCLYELGYVAIATVSETTWLPEKYMHKQMQRFKRLLIFWDNDTTGLENAKKFSNMYSIPYIALPIALELKDISDCIKGMGFNFAKNIVNHLINQVYE